MESGREGDKRSAIGEVEDPSIKMAIEQSIEHQENSGKNSENSSANSANEQSRTIRQEQSKNSVRHLP
jgi:hypothetical protein